MQEVLNHPLFQGAAAPFVVALIVASTFARTRFAWLAVILAYATMIALDTGFSLFPLTVARKTMLIGLLSPLAGIVADTYPRWSGAIATALVVVPARSRSGYSLPSLRNRTGPDAAVRRSRSRSIRRDLIALMLRLRSDGMRCGAAGLGLGLAAGIAGLLSASIGALIAGLAIAAACAAMVVVQIVMSRTLAAGFVGALPVGLLAALIAAGTQQLARASLVRAAVAVACPPRDVPARPIARLVHRARQRFQSVTRSPPHSFPSVAAWYAPAALCFELDQ